MASVPVCSRKDCDQGSSRSLNSGVRLCDSHYQQWCASRCMASVHSYHLGWTGCQRQGTHYLESGKRYCTQHYRKIVTEK